MIPGALDHQRSLPRNLAGREGRRFLHGLEIAQHEIVTRHRDLFAVFGFHLDIGHHKMASEIVTEQFLHIVGGTIEGYGDDEVFVLTPRHADALLTGRPRDDARQKNKGCRAKIHENFPAPIILPYCDAAFHTAAVTMGLHTNMRALGAAKRAGHALRGAIIYGR